MNKKMKISFALGLQLIMVAVIGDYVNWPYMRYVFMAGGIFVFIGLVLFIAIYSKD